MRKELIMSYEVVDGRLTDQKNEGELIRCGDCRYSYKDKEFGGLYCKGKRKSPRGYCDRGKRKE